MAILNYDKFRNMPLIIRYMFYFICRNEKERDKLIAYLKQNGIYAVFHYLSLHKSPYYKYKHDDRNLPNSDTCSDCLVRLPLYYELEKKDIKQIVNHIIRYFYA